MASRFQIDAAAIMAAGAVGVEALVDRTAEKVLQNQRRLVPTDTTALQRSLGIETRGEGADRQAFVGVDADFQMTTPKGPRHPNDYWEAVERGTSVAPAQPFIEPSIAQAMVNR